MQASAVKLISSIEINNDQNLVFDSSSCGFLQLCGMGTVLGNLVLSCFSSPPKDSVVLKK